MFTFSGSELPTFSVATLGQFRVTDPFFDANEFLSFAQGAYLKIHHATAAEDLASVQNLLSESMFVLLQSAAGNPTWSTPIVNVINASVLSVAHDNSVDTVTVRIAAKSSAKKRNDLVEDWTFTRPAANWGGLAAPPVTQCPSCGAPASLDQNGACRYCKVPIKGVAGDWRLVRTQLVTETKQQSSTGCASSWFWIFIVGTTVVLPLVIVGAVFWFVRDTTNTAFNSFPPITSPTFSVPNLPTVPTTPSTLIPPRQGELKGNVTLTSALNGGFAAESITFVGADKGTCKEQAAAATGLLVSSRLDGESGTSLALTITVSLPEGKVGPGTYTDATANVVLAPAPGQPPTEKSSGAWTGPASLTIANNTGMLSMTGLAAADPRWKALNGNVSFTCS